MNTFLAAIALVVMLLGIFALGILIAVWKTWWLHPLWTLLIVPLGGPSINFWHFLALNMFVHSVIGPTLPPDCKKDTEGSVVERQTARFAVLFFWPVITYYLVQWYMS